MSRNMTKRRKVKKTALRLARPYLMSCEQVVEIGEVRVIYHEQLCKSFLAVARTIEAAIERAYLGRIIGSSANSC